MTLVDDELWSYIPEFPDYQVSDHGEIINIRSGRPVRISRTNHGHAKITLCRDGVRSTRSVALLVAEAFVDPPDELSDQVIVLDGNLGNVWAYNLAWRPQHFAWKYARQLRTDQPDHYHTLSIQENVTGAIYPSVVDAAMTEGLLFEDIWRSTYTGSSVYPTHSVFEVVDRV